jgi:uncharacterized protein
MGGLIVETKRFDAEIKAVTDSGTVELYAAAFHNVDRTGEVIEPGAFKNLGEFVTAGWLAINHDWDDLPVASIETATQDGTGLLITAKFHSTPEAQQCRTVVKERLDRGKAVKCSIGYRVLQDATEDRGGESVRVLKAIEIFEASIVNMPANPNAHVVGIKSWTDGLDLAMAALKSGRIISSKNRERLCKCRDMLKEAHADLHSLLEETDPEIESESGIIVRHPDISPVVDGLSEADVLFLSYMERCSKP